MVDRATNSGDYDYDHLKDIQSCPPQGAAPEPGTFYAYHNSNPPGDEDFRTAAERGDYVGGDECQRRSNSIYSDLGALKKRVKAIKRRRPKENFFISSGEIKIEHGVLDDGDGPHRSFWVCGQHSMHAIFNRLVK
jgi:hypothetical protein